MPPHGATVAVMRIVSVLCLLLFSATARSSSQARPDLLGHWVFAADRTPPPAPGRPNFTMEFDSRQDARGWTVERGTGAQKTTSVYPFDGSESETRVTTSV